MMAEVQHVVSGNGAPTAIPPSNAAHYINLDTGEHYLASGTASVSDWGVPVGRPLHLVQEAPGVLALADGTAMVEVYAAEVAINSSFTLEVPVVTSGLVRSFDVISLTTDASNNLVFRTAMAGGFLYAGFLGSSPAGAEFVGGELVVPMNNDYVIRVYVTAVIAGVPEAGRQLLTATLVGGASG